MNDIFTVFADKIRFFKPILFHRVRVPDKFDDQELELRFIREFRLSGLMFIRFALMLGALLFIIFFVSVAIMPGEEHRFGARQVVRVVMAVILLSTFILVKKHRRLALANYSFIIGASLSISVFGIFIMSLLPMAADELRAGRWVVAMTIICWLGFGFSRMPVILNLIICIIGSILVLVSAGLHNDEYFRALFIYLTMANIIGWIMAVQIESRERNLFLAKRNLIHASIRSRSLAKTAQAADHAKSRILAAVNHDLRQPLASLALYVGQLREQLPDGDASLHATADCLDACVTAISSDLDHLAELGAEAPGGHVPVDMVDLRTVLERVVRVYGGLARDAGIRLVLRLPEGGGLPVWSNESRLWDILSNLVGNALKFGDASRERWVLVRVRRRRNRWIVVVQDNGIGIPAEDQSLIFDEYFRVSGAERSRRSGQGLGLSIARDAAAKLEGHVIDFCSRVGHGTRFTLEIPAAPVVAASTGAQARGPAAEALAGAGADRRWGEGGAITGSAGASGARAAGETDGTGAPADEMSCPVLLVEDDEAMSDVLGRTLERWGFSVRRAASGEEAIELTLAAQDLLTAIVSDFRLPGGWDGLRLIEQLRTLEGQRTPALLLSGEFRVEALRNDAPNDVRIMSKPPDVARLRAFLEQARSTAS